MVDSTDASRFERLYAAHYETTALSETVTRSRYSCAPGAGLIVYLHAGGHDWPAEMGTDRDQPGHRRSPS